MRLAVGVVDQPEIEGKTGRPYEQFWSSIADRLRKLEPGKAISVQIPPHISHRNFQTTARKSLLVRGLDCCVQARKPHVKIIISVKKDLFKP